jgi:hypothetical protein
LWIVLEHVWRLGLAQLVVRKHELGLRLLQLGPQSAQLLGLLHKLLARLGDLRDQRSQRLLDQGRHHRGQGSHRRSILRQGAAG